MRILLALALAIYTAAAVSAALAPAVDEVLDVWMVPHAHCDVGWLMSVDGYFNKRHWDGSENEDSVSNILTSVTGALDADRSLRFIWSEVKWIQLWCGPGGDAAQGSYIFHSGLAACTCCAIELGDVKVKARLWARRPLAERGQPWRRYPAQAPAMQAAFKRIIKRGQLEFVGAGWSQNDEVTTAYYDVVDNQVSHRP